MITFLGFFFNWINCMLFSSGLMLAVGIILYISAINDEVGHRPKPSEADEDTKKFDYEYGWSFFFAGTSFLLIMTTAVILVSLYLQRNSKREDLVKIIPGLGDIVESDVNDDVFASNNPTIILWNNNMGFFSVLRIFCTYKIVLLCYTVITSCVVELVLVLTTAVISSIFQVTFF